MYDGHRNWHRLWAKKKSFAYEMQNFLFLNSQLGFMSLYESITQPLWLQNRTGDGDSVIVIILTNWLIFFFCLFVFLSLRHQFNLLSRSKQRLKTQKKKKNTHTQIWIEEKNRNMWSMIKRSDDACRSIIIDIHKCYDSQTL